MTISHILTTLPPGRKYAVATRGGFTTEGYVYKVDSRVLVLSELPAGGGKTTIVEIPAIDVLQSIEGPVLQGFEREDSRAQRRG